jgi:hypothetical protein
VDNARSVVFRSDGMNVRNRDRPGADRDLHEPVQTESNKSTVAVVREIVAPVVDALLPVPRSSRSASDWMRETPRQCQRRLWLSPDLILGLGDASPPPLLPRHHHHSKSNPHCRAARVTPINRGKRTSRRVHTGWLTSRYPHVCSVRCRMLNVVATL